MKGIILAGGNGTRLHPTTMGVSKQLLPIYDKPLVYYPLSVLMLADIREILIISTPTDLPAFKRLFGDGDDWGLDISYAAQAQPNGLAEAFIIGADFIGQDDVCLVLGDNIFFGSGFSNVLRDARTNLEGCALFGHPTTEPQRYGVAELDASGRLVGIEEKPEHPKSDVAVTGLYMFDSDVVEIARNLAPSARGELEVTDVNREYLKRGRARLVNLGRGFTWLDAGTHDAMLESAELIQAIVHRQGLRIACLEEIALRKQFISAEQCLSLGTKMGNSEYGKYVCAIANNLMDR